MLWPEIGETPELPQGGITLGWVSAHHDFRVHSYSEQWEMTWVYIPAHTYIQNTHHKYIHTHKALFMEHLIEKIKYKNKSRNAKGRFLCAPNFTPQMPHLPPINSQSDVSQWEFVSPPGWSGLSFAGASVLPDPQVVHREPRAAYLSVVIVKCPWPQWARLATERWAGGLGKSSLRDCISRWPAAIMWIQCYNRRLIQLLQKAPKSVRIVHRWKKRAS